MSSIPLTSLELVKLKAARVDVNTLEGLHTTHIRSIYENELANSNSAFISLYNSLLRPVLRDEDTKEERFAWIQQLTEVIETDEWGDAALYMNDLLKPPYNSLHLRQLEHRASTPPELYPYKNQLITFCQEVLSALVFPPSELNGDAFQPYEILTAPYIKMIDYGKKTMREYKENE